MGRKSLHHHSWLDLWSFRLVALLLYLGNQPNTYMGIRKETPAHLGGIQHNLGVDILHGVGTAPSLIRLLR